MKKALVNSTGCDRDMAMKLLPVLTTRLLPALALAAVSLSLSNCAMNQPGGNAKFSTTFDPPAHRPQNPNNVRIKVSISKQRIYVVEGSRVLLATPCSVGAAHSPTPHGNFVISNKDFNHRRISSPGAGYPMTGWSEFMPAYGFHWGFVKPYPCTHGCIRMPKLAVAKFYGLIKVGTPVNIAVSQAEDATIGATLPVLDDTTLPDPPDSVLHSQSFFDDFKPKGALFVD